MRRIPLKTTLVPWGESATGAWPGRNDQEVPLAVAGRC